MFPFGRFEELGKQNMAFFERALKMFAPFQGEQRDPDRPEPAANPGADATALSDLKSQLDVLQKRINSMSRQKGRGKRRSKEPARQIRHAGSKIEAPACAVSRARTIYKMKHLEADPPAIHTGPSARGQSAGTATGRTPQEAARTFDRMCCAIQSEGRLE